MRLSTLLAPLLLASLLACAAPESDLYENDDPFSDPKADNPGLRAKVEIGQYAAIQEARQFTAPLGEVEAGERVLLIRQYQADGRPMVIAARLEQRKLVALASDDVERLSTEVPLDAIADTPYMRGLSTHRQSALDRLTPGNTAAANIQFTVTVDMCQSSKVWEKALFEWMVDLSNQRGEPTQVGIALTGLWAHRHTRDFQQLLDWQAEGKLEITWINHSYRHQLSKDDDGHFHFLTASNVNFDEAVHDLEELLLGQEQVFSPLFRFPGLTHNGERLGEVNDKSLFALDANGWIAKGEPISDGAVVLLHGNGNEAVGVDMFFDQLAGREDELLDGRLQLVSPLQSLPE